MFRVEFAREAYLELRKLRARDRAMVISAVERHLSTSPLLLGRRIKRLHLADGTEIYRLRVGDLRVYFDLLPEYDHIISRSIRVKARRTTGDIL